VGSSVLTTSNVFPYVDGRLFCEDVPVEQLVAEYGTPLYVYSASGIMERYRSFTGAFAALDPLIAYSVKANGNLAVLRLLAGGGGEAEAHSGPTPAPAPTS
jgi:diaminopimelate decarboxylase